MRVYYKIRVLFWYKISATTLVRKTPFKRISLLFYTCSSEEIFDLVIKGSNDLGLHTTFIIVKFSLNRPQLRMWEEFQNEKDAERRSSELLRTRKQSVSSEHIAYKNRVGWQKSQFMCEPAFNKQYWFQRSFILQDDGIPLQFCGERAFHCSAPPEYTQFSLIGLISYFPIFTGLPYVDSLLQKYFEYFECLAHVKCP